MTNETAMMIMACSATAHYVIAMVLFVYARHQAKYRSIAWIMTIFAVSATCVSLFGEWASLDPGILHPAALLGLMCVCYLQSIYPLSFVMPGYLQWRRMVKYALPAIILIAIYLIAMLLGSRPIEMDTIDDFFQHILSGDTLMRLAAVVVSLVYVINIFRLPHRLTHTVFPRYLIGYSLVLCLSALFYIGICVVKFNPMLASIYVLIFTVLNLYLSFRTLESMALELPKPTITTIEEPPSEKDLEKEKDFNELNQKRFERLEYWMQHNADMWKDYTFGRDNLCRQTGINRHLMLQCLRSKGYNNVHDYLSLYRIAELKRLIQQGEVSSLSECQYAAGFGTTKTVRSCFLKFEGITVEEYIEAHYGEGEE